MEKKRKVTKREVVEMMMEAADRTRLVTERMKSCMAEEGQERRPNRRGSQNLSLHRSMRRIPYRRRWNGLRKKECIPLDR